MLTHKDIIEFIASILEINPEIITPESRYGELENWDSLMHLRIIAELEEKYGINVPMDDVPNIKAIKDLLVYFKNEK
jgi:acyl carrier protein